MTEKEIQNGLEIKSSPRHCAVEDIRHILLKMLELSIQLKNGTGILCCSMREENYMPEITKTLEGNDNLIGFAGLIKSDIEHYLDVLPLLEG